MFNPNQAKIKIKKNTITVIRLGFLRVVFSWEGGGQFEPPFIFQEEFIQYQYNFTQLLNNLFKLCWKRKNADIICCKLTSLVSLWQRSVKKSKQLRKIDENS